MDLDILYSKKPLKYEDGIPIFSHMSKYVENYERISADHINEMNSSGANPFIDERLWNQIEDSTINLLLKHTSGGKILDVGVGLGRLLSKIDGINNNFEKYGFDISLNYLRIAKSKGISVCLSLIEDMPYQENSFDAIVCTDVLEHVL
ncbi:MAG: class I SAM-dependent methyltransferase, partial [Saprospiraceae bacterium]